MALTQLTLPQLQALLTSAYASAAALPANTAPGGVMGSIFNAIALAGLELENQVAAVLAVSRLATSVGADVDSFVNPWGISRLTATASTLTETVGLLSPAAADTLVPVGTVVQTPGGLQFSVVTGGAGYDSQLGSYHIAAGQKTVDVPVQCLINGSIGNVQTGQITQVFSGPGGAPAAVQTCTNALAATTGVDDESDAALKARFTIAVSSGHVATKNAIAAAILGVQTGLTYSLGDQINADGSAHAAFFTAVVNEIGQSTGPSAALLVAVQAAIEGVRSAGISFAAIGPTLLTVNAVATLQILDGYNGSDVIAAAVAAYTQFLDTIGLDPDGAQTICPFGKVYAILYAVPGVRNVEALTLNAGTADVTAGFAHQLVCGTVAFTAG